MNRETWRQVRKMPWQEAEKAIHSVYDPIVRQNVVYAHKIQERRFLNQKGL